MTRARWLIALCLVGACGACSGGAEPERAQAPVQTHFWSDAPMLLPYVEAMVVRMSKATGRGDLAIAPDGIPFVPREDLISPFTGRPSCGQTFGDDLGQAWYVAIDPTPPSGCGPTHVTIVHESFHALAPCAPNRPEMPCAKHTVEGVFATGSRASRIDSASLAELCEHFECAAFVPEVAE